MIVWGMSYRPKPASYPNLEVIEGESRHVRVIDDTPDGGAKLKTYSQHEAGRRVQPDSLPKIIRWMGTRKLLDFEGARTCYSVSDRFRELIEEIEPSVHQFEPIKYVNKNSELIEGRWVWIVCNRLDTVDRERTNLKLIFGPTGIGIWCPTGVVNAYRFFSPSAIGNAQFWFDRHYVGGSIWVSDNAKKCLEAAKITGPKFTLAKQEMKQESGEV